MSYRECIDCHATMSIESFPLNGKSRRTRCVGCYRDYNNAKKRAGYDADKEKEKFLKSKYGLTMAQYNAMLEKQNGVCAICERTETASNMHGERKFLAVDHDHSCCPGVKTCGKCVRGLLCHRCNVAIGLFGDNMEALKRAVDYLGGDIR